MDHHYGWHIVKWTKEGARPHKGAEAEKAM